MASRNQKIVDSPVKKWYQWKNQYDDKENIIGGALVSYNKELEKDEPVELPFSMAIINDSCVTFKGYDDKIKEGVWSNEGYDKNHTIILKNSTGELMRFKLGNYQKVKDEIKGLGAKYCRVIYAAVVNENEEFELIGITLSGAALTGGIDLDNYDPSERMHGYINASKTIGSRNIFRNYLTIKEAAVKKKGKGIKFFVPVFEVGQPIKEAENQQLLELNTQLDDYHAYYYSKKHEPAPAIQEQEDFT